MCRCSSNAGSIVHTHGCKLQTAALRSWTGYCFIMCSVVFWVNEWNHGLTLEYLGHHISLLCSRSLCTVVCKWTYSPLDGWDDSFWATIGLEDLIENNHSKIGKLIKIVFKYKPYNTNGLQSDPQLLHQSLQNRTTTFQILNRSNKNMEMFL